MLEGREEDFVAVQIFFLIIVLKDTKQQGLDQNKQQIMKNVMTPKRKVLVQTVESDRE